MIVSTPTATSTTNEARVDSAAGFRKAALLVAFVLIGLAGSIAIGDLAIATPPQFWIALHFFQSQDSTTVLVVIGALVVAALAPAWAGCARIGRAAVAAPRLTVAVLMATSFLISVIGTDAIFHDRALSYDEVFATFDQQTLVGGHLIAPVAPEWRADARALAPHFMVPIVGDKGFVSAYLPGNAALRALVALVASPKLTGPLLAALAILAVFGVARRLWPDRMDAALVAALLIATSSQVLVTAMTPYAMTAHLTLDVIWLWFYLRDTRSGHVAALATGFLATGLHQMAFHPLFVAPFVLTALTSVGRRRVGLFYAIGYAAICLFWLSWWQVAARIEGMEVQTASGAGGIGFAIQRILSTLQWDWLEVVQMPKNLLRFFVWQNPMMLVLAFAAVPAIRRRDGIMAELASGFLLTTILLLMVMSFQGNGWGFRYFHGLIGSLALLAGQGWIELSAHANARGRAVLASAMTVVTTITLVALVPIQIGQVRTFVAPYIRAGEAIDRAKTDLVFVDRTDLRFAGDLVRNDPYLLHRPLVFDLTYLNEQQIIRLCARHSVGLFDVRQGRALGIPDKPDDALDAVRARSRAVMARLSCGAPIPAANEP